MNSFKVKGNIADIPGKKFFSGIITIQDGRIAAIDKNAESVDHHLPFILPGFVDSHVHIESSMLVHSGRYEIADPAIV